MGKETLEGLPPSQIGREKAPPKGVGAGFKCHKALNAGGQGELWLLARSSLFLVDVLCTENGFTVLNVWEEFHRGK